MYPFENETFCRTLRTGNFEVSVKGISADINSTVFSYFPSFLSLQSQTSPCPFEYTKSLSPKCSMYKLYNWVWFLSSSEAELMYICDNALLNVLIWIESKKKKGHNKEVL